MDTPIYIINLPQRADRRARIQSILPASWKLNFTSELGISYDAAQAQHFRADGYELFPWQIESDNEWWNRPLKFGEIGCTVSHHRVWELMDEANEDVAIVLEDDVIPTDGYEERISTALAEVNLNWPNWDLLYLGRDSLTRREDSVSKSLVRPDYSYGTFAYCLSNQGVRKLLTYSLLQNIVPADEFLPATFCDHPREDVKIAFPKCLEAFAITPCAFRYLDDPQWGSDTEDSDFVTAG